MTDHRHPNRPGGPRFPVWLILVVTGGLLQACTHAGPSGSRLRVFAADVTGAAKMCEAPTLAPTQGQAIETSLKMINDGGWCGLQAHQEGPKPFEAGLLTVRPNHGSVLIHEVGDETRIDYTPDHGFVGSDEFTVKLIPGSATIHVSATISAPAKS